MSAYSECYASSVNRWECDENDHMNVRFFLRKSMEALRLGLVDVGLVAPARAAEITAGIRVQHMRFLAEARFATPITGRLGVLAVDGDEVTVLTELRHAGTEATLINIVHEIKLPAAAGDAASGIELIELPENAGVRGIAATAAPYGDATREAILSCGFQSVSGGVIQDDECERGVMAWHVHMGRVSDMVPVLWMRFLGKFGHPEDDGVGRAVVEHRLTPYHSLAAGSRFELLAGLTVIQSKVQEITHFIFDLEQGRPVCFTQVMSVSLDLKLRKAVAMPPAEEELARKFLISPEQLATLAASSSGAPHTPNK